MYIVAIAASNYFVFFLQGMIANETLGYFIARIQTFLIQVKINVVTLYGVTRSFVDLKSNSALLYNKGHIF